MTTDERFDATISTWFEEAGPARLPERVLSATFERTRRSRQQLGWRGVLGGHGITRFIPALGGAAVVVVAAALALNFFVNQSRVVGPPVDPRSPFEGTWVSTSDTDGGTQTMTVRFSADGVVEIAVRDDVASVCARTPSTMTGTGRIERGTELVIPSPVYTCDDGSQPQALSGPPLDEQLRNWTLVLDPQADTLRDGVGGVWLREALENPSLQPTTTPLSEAEVNELLNAFLDARVAGAGAEQYLNDPYEVPLLYATSSGPPYERAEFEQVRGIEWPYGYSAFKVRLFAGDTLVEQLIFTPNGRHAGLAYDRNGFATDIAPTTEGGQPLALPFYPFIDVGLTLHAAHPWISYPESFFLRLIPEGPGVLPTTDGGQRSDWDHLWLMAVTAPGEAGCEAGPDPADARALAESIRSYPGLEASAPVAAVAGGAEPLMMDVVIAAGTTLTASVNEDGDLCPNEVLRPIFDYDATWFVDKGVATGTATGDWMRLYLFDAPEGSSIRILAIAIVAPESRFERAVEAAAPVVDSVTFHAP